MPDTTSTTLQSCSASCSTEFTRLKGGPPELCAEGWLVQDLNLVINKPATACVEANGRPDTVVAAEAWERHRLRNESVSRPTMPTVLPTVLPTMLISNVQLWVSSD